MPNYEVNERVINQALDKFGFSVQVNKCIEELAELTVELSRYNGKRWNRSAVIEEIAGVLITLSQVFIIINAPDEEIQRTINQQIEKLRGILNQ